MVVHVDDIIVTGKNVSEIESIKSKLAFDFEMKDFRESTLFLENRNS